MCNIKILLPLDDKHVLDHADVTDSTWGKDLDMADLVDQGSVYPKISRPRISYPVCPMCAIFIVQKEERLLGRHQPRHAHLHSFVERSAQSSVQGVLFHSRDCQLKVRF